MDVARTLLVFTFAAMNAGMEPAFAAPTSPARPVQHTAYFAGQGGWANPGPTTTPTITAQPNTANPTTTYDRYGYPQSGARPAVSPPPSIPDRAQNAAVETANTLRDGIETGVRAAGDQLSRGATDATQGFNQQFQDWPGAASRQLQSTGSSLRSAAEQTLGTPGKPKYSNPFAPPAPQPAPAPTTPGARKNIAPPPWPNAPATTNVPPSQPWPAASTASTPVAPAERNAAAPPSNTQVNNSWNMTGSNVAAPPLAATQPAPPNNNVAPAGNTASGGAPVYPAESYRSQQPINSPLVNSPQPSTPTAATKAAAPADDWARGWDTNADTTRAPIGRSANNTTVTSPPRDTGSTPAQPSVTITQDANKSSTAKPTDSWSNDIWAKPTQSASGTPAVPATSAAVTKSAQPAAANNSNSPQANQPAVNSPVLNSPTIGSAGSNNFAGPPLSAPQPATSANTAKPNQPAAAPAAAPATGDEKPWVTLIAVILSLAGSLAANLFLGWSYIDARQKYQSLVRRTADTFRRTKAAAA